jgi:HEXXH motif-containing protein
MTHLPTSYLVLPEPGDRTVPQLQQEVKKIALKRLLTHPTDRLERPLARTLSSARRVLRALLGTQPKALMAALGNPDVLTPLLVLEVGQEITGQEPGKLLSAAIPALMLELAHHARAGAVPETILWDLPIEVVPDSTGFRLLRFEPAARGFLADPLGAEFSLRDETNLRLPPGPAALEGHPDVRTERPFHALRKDLPRLQLSLWDSNPLSMFEAHPDKDGNAISLGDRPLQDWTRSFGEALELIRLALPHWFEEIKQSARRFVPVGYLPERHLSATYREAPGVAYLTLCDNPLTLAEAMIHETQHTKANLLSWLDPIVFNGHTTWTTSPVRPDLRPLWGVLLAVHAFVPVSALHHRLAELDHPVTHTERFPRRRAEVLAGNHRGLKAVLDSSEPTETGKRLITEMHQLHEFLRLASPPAPAGMDIDPEILPPG